MFWLPLRKLHLPRKAFLPFFEVFLQYSLQLFLQDTEGLPGGQAQSQGWLSLQGSTNSQNLPRALPDLLFDHRLLFPLPTPYISFLCLFVVVFFPR